MSSKERAIRAIKDHLTGLGFDKESINRIILEDLLYLMVWQPQPDPPEQLAEAEAVIAFSFGFGPARRNVPCPPDQYHPLLYEPGKTNESLADFIVPFAQRGISVFAQWEIAEALRDRELPVSDSQVARPGKKYLGTQGVVEQFLAAGVDRFKSVLLVAHRHHAFRCRETTKTVFQKNKKGIAILVPDTPAVYDSRSVQPWTRSLKEWVAYEVGNQFNNRFRGNM